MDVIDGYFWSEVLEVESIEGGIRGGGRSRSEGEEQRKCAKTEQMRLALTQCYWFDCVPLIPRSLHC